MLKDQKTNHIMELMINITFQENIKILNVVECKVWKSIDIEILIQKLILKIE